jgi:hypothetical protein
MSYLTEPTSTSLFGVVKIGNFISVDEGIISLEQDVSPSSDVNFNEVNAGNIFSNGDIVVTSVTPSEGPGISVTDIVSVGQGISFTVNNTGVLTLTAGSGIAISNSTGDITISATGADIISVRRVTTNYTPTEDDEYIGVFSPTNLTITLPPGTDGRVYTIKNEYGQGAGKITLQPSFPEKVDGKTNYVVQTPNQSVSVVFRGDSWWII